MVSQIKKWHVCISKINLTHKKVGLRQAYVYYTVTRFVESTRLFHQGRCKIEYSPVPYNLHLVFMPKVYLVFLHISNIMFWRCQHPLATRLIKKPDKFWCGAFSAHWGNESARRWPCGLEASEDWHFEGCLQNINTTTKEAGDGVNNFSANQVTKCL